MPKRTFEKSHNRRDFGEAFQHLNFALVDFSIASSRARTSAASKMGTRLSAQQRGEPARHLHESTGENSLARSKSNALAYELEKSPHRLSDRTKALSPRIRTLGWHEGSALCVRLIYE